MKCPTCDGKGGWTELVSPELGGPYYDCPRCQMTGRVSLFNILREKFWNWIPIWFLEWYGDRLAAKETPTNQEGEDDRGN